MAVPDKKRRKLVISAVRGDNIVEATYGMLASQDGKSWTSELLQERKQDLIQEEKWPAEVKSEHRIALADCFAVALAREKRGAILTGDPEFKKVEKLVEIDWLTK